MKRLLFLFLGVFYLFAGCASRDKTDTVVGNPEVVSQNANASPSIETNMKIKVGTNTFNATLSDNATAAAFQSMLPLTLDMTELNGNEKYFDLPTKLPTNASNPRNIQPGELMLYGNNTLVLFYQSFSTVYSYTRIGRIDNTEGLAAALGSGSVTVTFELE